MNHASAWALVLLVLLALPALSPADGAGERLPGFDPSPWFGEQVREERASCGVRLLINAPARMDASRPTLVLFYATPNGNSIEQTLGCRTVPGMGDWHFDIQHVAAQTRRLREVDRRENLVLVCVEADGKSWPAWRRTHPDGPTLIRGLVEAAAARVPGSPVRLALAGHSGGGAFLVGFLEGGDSVPASVERIAFLDANYSYSDALHHGERLLAWLRGREDRHLFVLAYDDRNITLNGKRVVGPEGGTYRATQRMVAAFEKEMRLECSESATVRRWTGMHGQLDFRIALNPDNKILHTALVGEWNGLLAAITQGTPEAESWGRFGGPRAYGEWVQPAADERPPAIPKRAPEAPGGREVLAATADLPLAGRERAILAELERGNLPRFLRQFARVSVAATDSAGREHRATYEVMPDYLAVGSDADFVRVPLTPKTALQVAERFECGLPTRKMVDDIYREATVKPEPRPLTEEREAVPTFLRHNALIQEQLAGRAPGTLVAGIKKDVVVTIRLAEQPGRVAIYGWHRTDGKPIQPLSLVHRDTYVDYSHGVRLIREEMTVDGRPARLRDVLRDPLLSCLVSDEGPVTGSTY